MALTQATKELIKNIDPSQLNQAGALNGQVLKYSTTANKWEPGTVAGGGGGGSGNDITINGAALAKAWVNFSGTKNTSNVANTDNTDRYIASSYNVTSVTRTGLGRYTINFNPGTFTDANYVYTFGVKPNVSGNDNAVAGHFGNKTTSSIQIICDDDNSADNNDFFEICIVFYGIGGDISGNVVDNTPVGIINWFGSTTPPTGYLECNGAAVLRTAYPDLDAAIYCGNATNGIAGFGYRCTSNTNPTGTRNATGQYIVLPDLRSEFIRGWDNGRNIDTGRAFGSWQKGTLFGHDNTATNYGVVGVVYTGGDVVQTISLPAVGLDNYNIADYPNIQLASAISTGNTATLPQFAGNAGSSGTTRPRNVALLACIKAQKTFSSSAVIPSNNDYTTVGNARVGIFASAVCFIPSSPGTGTWTAPAGCFTARVTIVGGGATAFAGGRSHFNYPTGTTTAANEMFAAGGATNAGGNAGWNGINDLAIGGTLPSAGGSGGAAGGGYGGGGGRGGAVSSFGGAGASFGNVGTNGVVGGGVNGGGGGGGSGGVGGDGGDGVPSQPAAAGGSAGGSGGGSPTLSYAATLQTNFRTAISQSPGRGGGNSGTPPGAGGWCSAIVSVVPGQSYSYAVGVAGGAGASYGMVVIEW